MSAHDIIAGHLAFALGLAATQERPLLAYLIEMAILENDNPSDHTASLETEKTPVPSDAIVRYMYPDAAESDLMLT